MSKRVKVETVTVTPAMARRLLENNTDNRPLRQGWIDELATYIRDDRWQLSQDAIAISEDNTILNGQHRLWAITLAEKSAPLLVARGFEKVSQLIMDVGQKRNQFDAVVVTHLDDKARAEVVRVVGRMAQGFHHWMRLKNDQFPEIYDICKESAAWAVEEFSKYSHRKGVYQLGVKAVVARAHQIGAAVPLTRLEEFVKTLATGEYGEGDYTKNTAAVTLRDWLLQNSTRRGGAAWSHDVYVKVEAALTAFLERRPLKRIQGVTEEAYKIPSLDRRRIPVPIKKAKKKK